MRGGTANVTVCVSEEPIASPLIHRPRGLLVMNRPSLEKFGPRVKPGGVIVVNTSMVDAPAGRDDCRVIEIAARDVAAAAGNERAANFVMLGAYVGADEFVPPAPIEAAIEREFTGRKARFAPDNVAAFRAGLEAGRSAAEPKEVTP
jgi:2-oxoglutarate ferredoxin oxidoreductase subunit gamma